MEIGTYVNQIIDSEVSGNVIDLCPVGALTSKPYSFIARPWELRSHQTVDVMDSLCSRIKLDVKNSEVLRVLPSENSSLNEDWISDKTRFFYDSLRIQRLYSPLVKVHNVLVPVSWEVSFFITSKFLNFFLPESLLNFANSISLYANLFSEDKFSFSAILGDLVDIETLFVLRDFFFQFGSVNLFHQSDLFFSNSSDFRSMYFLNVSLEEIEGIDFCAFFGLNPRLECPLLNLRVRKSFLNNASAVFVFGFATGLTYSYFQEGNNFLSLGNFFSGKSYASRKLIDSKLPLLLVGSFFLGFFPIIFFLMELLC